MLSSLPEDVLRKIHLMVRQSYLFLAPVCKQWYKFEKEASRFTTNFESMMASHSTIRESGQSRGGSEALLKNNAWCFLAKHVDGGKLTKMADELLVLTEWNEFSVGPAGFHENLMFFRWLTGKSTIEWDPDLALSCNLSNSSNSVNFLKHMHDYFGYTPGMRSCQAAARLGKITNLQWLKEIGCDVENMKDITQVLAEEGHLGTLKWANSNGFPCDQNTLDAARYANRGTVVRYLRTAVLTPQ